MLKTNKRIYGMTICTIESFRSLLGGLFFDKKSEEIIHSNFLVNKIIWIFGFILAILFLSPLIK